MVFSSITFLFFFLPAVLVLYALSGRWRNLLLLLVSLLFYAWGEGVYLVVMLTSICLNYGCGRLIGRWLGEPPLAKLALAGSLLVNFSLLAFFKYANFIVDNGNALLTAAQLPPLLLSPTSSATPKPSAPRRPPSHRRTTSVRPCATASWPRPPRS